MGTKNFRFLPYDMARCYGKGCSKKEQCRRHTQIEADRQVTDGIERRISYTTTLIDKDTDECNMRIEE
jgi:hypothetical protein